MDEKLKPCPFCGVNGLPHPLDHKEGCYLRYFYEILAEGATTGGDVMREAWNTRAERTCTFSDALGAIDRPTCSVCGYEADAYECDMWNENGETHWEYIMNYCNGCGAKVAKAYEAE